MNIHEVIKRATPGPWEYRKAQNYDGFCIAPRGTLPTLAACEGFGEKMTVECFNFPGQTEANAALLAHCRNEFADLLKIVEQIVYANGASRETIEYARTKLDGFREVKDI